MEEHGVTQTEHMATIEAHAVAQQVQQVHVATYTEHSMLSADEDSPSSPEDTSYDDSDILNSTAADEVTAHLAAAGPVGMAAAAAVATGKKRKRPHVFESNPSIRKRQQTRLLRKLRATLDEYTTRVGQQAIVLCISPSKPNPVFKVFGAAPLENVVRKYKSMILEDLESALAEHAPAPQEVNSELPPLTIDGIPVSVDKMTQAQLRAFIPEMLKYSTGRGKPGWGKESCKPIWWPEDIPWANVRSDVRTEEQKQRVSWTQALRTIVKNCYKQHGREDLLYAFEDQQTQTQATTTHSIAHLVPSQTVVQTFSNPDGTVSLIQVSKPDGSGRVGQSPLTPEKLAMRTLLSVHRDSYSSSSCLEFTSDQVHFFFLFFFYDAWNGARVLTNIGKALYHMDTSNLQPLSLILHCMCFI